MTFNVRFPGQYFDAESGMHYNRHRYYSPGLGRYVSADPIGQAGGVNVYGYAGSNPQNNIDSSGLFINSRDAAIAAGGANALALAGENALGAMAYFGSAAGAGAGAAALICEMSSSSEGGAGDDSGGSDGQPEASSSRSPSSTAPASPVPQPPDKQKKGRPKSNRDQNKQVRDAAKENGLDRSQREKLKREVEYLSRVEGENLSYHDIRAIAAEIKAGVF